MAKKFRSSFVFASLLSIALLGGVSAAQADIAGTVTADLAANPNGGAGLAASISDLIANAPDPAAAANAVLAALGNANGDQQTAVGEGLASAASLLSGTNPAAAAAIASAANNASQDVQTGYNTGSGQGGGGSSGNSTAPSTLISSSGGSESGGTNSTSPH